MLRTLKEELLEEPSSKESSKLEIKFPLDQALSPEIRKQELYNGEKLSLKLLL